MKVAIIGAGISGLACAYTFEKMGISCDIYERKHTIGNLFSFGELILQVMHRPYKDPLSFLKSQLRIPVVPLNKIKKIIIKSLNKKTSIEGDLGYILERGQGQQSVENQLAGKINSKINFNINADYRQLAASYDYVVVATGNSMIAKQLTEYADIVSSRIKGGIAIGEFDINTVYVWFNTMYARSGFGYLVPLSRNKASIILVSTYTQKEEIENMWHTFLYQEKLNYEIIETFETEMDGWIAKEHKIGNIYLIGNAGGFLEPCFGFGLVNSLETGVYSAQAIVKGENYEQKIGKIVDKVNKMADFRRVMDNMRDKDYDRFLSIIGNPIIKTLIYKANLDVINYLHTFIKILKKPSE
ncbi:MAG TPA: NAD(P)/FAD-dependent oxidoreductase [Clostridia bacterium]|nr:NAD(P)/FAD-dependent oxidoreductase [Clostridia bacterium]